MKITAKLELTVVYDDGGYEDFDPDARLHELVDVGINQGILTGEDGPITIDSYEVKTSIEEVEG